MNNYRTLRVLDRMRLLFERMGIDYPVMRRILGLKLTLDKRRTTGAAALFRGGNRSSDSEDQPSEKSGIGRTLFFYALYGALSSFFLLIDGPYMIQVGIVLAVLLFVMMTSMLSDFSSVMLDVRDKSILHTKPVDGRTLGMAKALHILIYFAQFSLALGAVPVLVSIVRQGPAFAGLLFLSLVLGGLLVAVFTALVYLFVLKLFDGETLKDMINYVQIAMTVFMMIGYQVAIRAMDFSRFADGFQPGWWELALPPLWYSASFEWLLNGRGEAVYVVPALLGLMVPLLGAILFYRLMPGFERSLEKLSGTTSRRRGSRIKKWNRMLATLFCRSKEEQAFYVFASSMLAGEREFKLNVYPSLGFSIAIPFIFLFSFAAGSGDLMAVDYSAGLGYLNIYACAIMIPTLVMMMKYSGGFKGSWIYNTAPLTNVDVIYRGTLKALLVRLFLPLFLVESILFVLLFGMRIVPDLLVILAASALLFPLTLRILERELPFSLPFPTSSRESGGLKMFGAMLLLGMFAALHYGVLAFLPGFGVWLLLAVMLAGNFWIWHGTLFAKG
ncbi:hypothetical protein [Saccharibacillus kuerlensis]|uniref:ABC-2 type transport system permease protein n=1 Tax=Saccharibacillus kuerlensis TaxID=459527 RepID=A0ABQ2KUJ1_9BACL|nr:hypothetical protein [Saccharibacillus kuerlensis]GGN93774.1 hypothetical protein GCM10010969_07850 [Saccharibacillus kuerlensis]